MADTLYETDTLAWAEQQAPLLRRMPAGERVPETCPFTLDELLERDGDGLPGDSR